MLRFGLCCLFIEEPVRFRTTTASSLLKLPRDKALSKLSAICLDNSRNLQKALEILDSLDIRSFRITSQFLPVFTHPRTSYALDELPDADEITASLRTAGKFAAAKNIRLSFHPDQFIIISSPREDVVANSARDLEYHAMLADLIGADVINVHLGGVYGSKKDATGRFSRNFKRLPANVRRRLTLENDDVSYTPSDLHPLCMELGIPLVYDVHHHRCNPDGISTEAATELCMATWRNAGRGEPYFHVSSPKNGWDGAAVKSHADYIDPSDFPRCWLRLKYDFTVDVEAKAKELAVLRLMKDIRPLLRGRA